MNLHENSMRQTEKCVASLCPPPPRFEEHTFRLTGHLIITIIVDGRIKIATIHELSVSTQSI